MVESGAYLAYVSIYTASKVQKESIRTILVIKEIGLWRCHTRRQ